MARPLVEVSVVELIAEARLGIPGEGMGFAPVGPSPRTLRRTRLGIGSGEPLGLPKRVASMFGFGEGKYGGVGVGDGPVISCRRPPMIRSIALAATRSTFD